MLTSIQKAIESRFVDMQDSNKARFRYSGIQHFLDFVAVL